MSHNWRSFYSREAAEYDARRYRSWYGRLFSHLHHEAVNQALQSVPADSMILEVASGTGHNLPVLSPHGRLVIASDLTIDMLKVSQKNLSTCGNFAYVVNDAFRLPFPDAQFDIVISSRFLHLFSPAQQQTLIAEMARVLKPNKYLIVDYFNRWHWQLLSPAIQLYRVVTRKRPTQDTRNCIREIHAMLTAQGFQIEQTIGVSSYLLILCRFLPVRTAVFISRLFQRAPLLPLAEQFLLCARKRT